MQVNLVASSDAGSGPARRKHVLLPDVLALLQPTPEAQSRHEARASQRTARARERGESYEQALQEAVKTARPSEVILKAERGMLPGSYAAREEQVATQQRRQAEHTQPDFRRTLSQARSDSANNPEQSGSTPRCSSSSEQPMGESVPHETSTADAPRARIAPAREAAGARGPTPGTGSDHRPPPARLAANLLTPAPRVAAQSSTTSTAAGARVTAVGRVTPATGATGGSTSAGRGSGAPVASNGLDSAAARRAAPAQAARVPDASATSKSDANVERIVRLIHAQIGRQRSVATLRLDPPELGSLRLRMDLRRDQLTLDVETQTHAARRLLSEQIDTLRQNLEAAGIHLERIEIRVQPATSESPDAQQSPRQDVPAEDQPFAGQPDDETAGGGSHPDTDAHASSTADDLVGQRSAEPAAESLVNILA